MTEAREEGRKKFRGRGQDDEEAGGGGANRDESQSYGGNIGGQQAHRRGSLETGGGLAT